MAATVPETMDASPHGAGAMLQCGSPPCAMLQWWCDGDDRVRSLLLPRPFLDVRLSFSARSKEAAASEPPDAEERGRLVRAHNAIIRRETGPGVPSPIFLPSISTTGSRKDDVLVRKASSAAMASRTLKGRSSINAPSFS